MAHKELTDYILRHLKKGTSLQKIKDHLLRAGHSHSAIEEAAQQAQQTLQQETKNHPLVKHKGWIAGGVIVVVIVGA
ncbi:hypothetical protein D6774_01670, partial [Candidatus Woesearchaeota archaeon]